jgi:hypothetical protein
VFQARKRNMHLSHRFGPNIRPEEVKNASRGFEFKNIVFFALQNETGLHSCQYRSQYRGSTGASSNMSWRGSKTLTAGFFANAQISLGLGDYRQAALLQRSGV